jgi:hypothetical protein
MDISTPEQLTNFLTELGRRCPEPTAIYLFGGSAVVILGGPRSTVDIDFTLQASAPEILRPIIDSLAVELGLDLEESIPIEFMPLPTGVETRHRLLGQYGALTAYLFDPYSIALMKIDRAFETDVEDVHFLIQSGAIDLAFLEHCIEDVAQRYDEPRKLRSNFQEMKRGL